jgi:hypothetical protein
MYALASPVTVTSVGRCWTSLEAEFVCPCLQPRSRERCKIIPPGSESGPKPPESFGIGGYAGTVHSQVAGWALASGVNVAVAEGTSMSLASAATANRPT